MNLFRLLFQDGAIFYLYRPHSFMGADPPKLAVPIDFKGDRYTNAVLIQTNHRFRKAVSKQNELSQHLVDNANMRPHPLWTEVMYVGPVNHQNSVGWVIEPHQQCWQSRLAWTTRPHHCRDRATRYDQIQTSEYSDLGSRGIAKVNITELDLTL